jgi:hypothetical protein
MFVCISCFNLMVLGCSSSEVDQTVAKTYLDEIITFHFEEVKKNKYSFEEYLELTKPYGIWDVRPRDGNGVMIGDRIAKPGDVSHYHYGLFCALFDIPEKDLQRPVEDFLKQVSYKESLYKESALRYVNQLTSLTMKIVNSNHNIFISHKNFQRVGDIFLEKGEYWKYDIRRNSPYVISNKKISLKDISFGKGDKEILKELRDLGLYGAVHQDNAVLILVDGLLNYSYGYMFSPLHPALIRPGPLFNFLVLEKVHDNVDVYFYLSN